eukprot:comp17185_c0_seq1/m.16067 comp17185_c0_seq1/g.16067  ORF comp17185_c0_seq1/g.16067 comp17185_c0_seq1/m.16067 type:complete len:202 (-) comp17185_c0_seq1:265-870(-)
MVVARLAACVTRAAVRPVSHHAATAACGGIRCVRSSALVAQKAQRQAAVAPLLQFCPSVRWYCSAGNNDNNETPATPEGTPLQTLASIKPRMHIAFTCNVCKQRVGRSFSKRSYTHGVVIITCPGCHSRHLIADNLGWFKDVKGRNIEEIMANKGERAQRLLFNGEETIEIDPDQLANGNHKDPQDPDTKTEHSQNDSSKP